MIKWVWALAVGLVPGVVFATQPVNLELERAWVRALPPTQTLTAGYLSVINRGDEAVVITGASTPLADRAEIHRSVQADGYARMERVQQVELGAGQRLEFSPGGLHLMLLDMPRMPAPGETAPLCLLLEDGSEHCVEAEVRKAEPGKGHAHHGHH